MRAGLLMALVAFATACGATAEAERVTTVAPPTSTAPPATEAPTTSTTADVGVERTCAASPYFPAVVPERALVDQPPPSDAPFHPFMSIAGASTRFLVDAAGEPVVAVMRGTLPPEPWAAQPETIRILDGQVPAAVGPLSDGVWSVAWILSEDDPCDHYTMVLFPPTSREEAMAVAASL